MSTFYLKVKNQLNHYWLIARMILATVVTGITRYQVEE